MLYEFGVGVLFELFESKNVVWFFLKLLNCWVWFFLNDMFWLFILINVFCCDFCFVWDWFFEWDILNDVVEFVFIVFLMLYVLGVGVCLIMFGIRNNVFWFFVVLNFFCLFFFIDILGVLLKIVGILYRVLFLFFVESLGEMYVWLFLDW